MKKENGITMITLVVTIIVLIILAGVSITTLLGDNGIITKAKQTRQNILYAGQEEQEQLNQLFWEMEQGGNYTEDEENDKKDQMIELLQKQVEELKQQVADLQGENAELEEQVANLNSQIEDLNKQINDLKAEIAEKDIEIADLQKEVALKQESINNLQGQLDSLNSQLAQTNATAAHILKDYRAYSGGQLVVGTMPNNGAVSASLNAGQSYTIPAGYHNGSGKVTANSLASQTQGTATANNISSGMTAWVNGQLITGNGADVNNAENNSKKVDTIVYKWGTIPNNGKYYAQKTENYIIDKDVSNIKYVFLYIVLDNDANASDYRFRLDGNIISNYNDLNPLFHYSGSVNNYEERVILFDVSAYSNFKVEVYSTNNYGPPGAAVYYTCSFLPDANITQEINQ